MSRMPAQKMGTIAPGVTEQLLLEAPIPDNVEPRIYCFPRGAVQIVEVAPQRVTLRNEGPLAAGYMLVWATPGIQAFEGVLRAGFEFLKARRKG